MTAPVNTTRLQAVNTMLTVLGQQPVNTITGAVPPDVAVALSVLQEVEREILVGAWYFNTERNVEFTPDVSGYVAIPTDVVDVDSETMNVVVKAGRLYNVDDRTDVFTGLQKLTTQYYRDFTEVPEAARQYIMTRAARKLFERMNGQAAQVVSLQRDELMAKAALMQQEAESADHTIFDNTATYRVVNRPSPLRFF